MTEPTTEAGKYVAATYWREDGEGPPPEAIAAIEAEAAHAALTALRERVEGLHQRTREHYGAGPDESVRLDPAAVLAEIDRALGGKR